MNVSKYKPSIFQGSLNLSAVSKPYPSLTIEYPAEGIMLRIVLALLIVLACSYLYFVSSSVINIMATREAASHTAAIEASIGSLEGEYFSLSQSLSPTSAVAIGLSPIQSTNYVTRLGTVGIAETRDENRI